MTEPEIRLDLDQRRDRQWTVLAAAGVAVIVVSAVLPWRADGHADPEVGLQLFADVPGLAVGYAVVVLAALTTMVMMVRSRGPRRRVFWTAVLSAVAAALVMIALPLPLGSALGAGADGRMFEVPIPTYRTWGSYLFVGGAAAIVTAAALFVRGSPADRVGSDPAHH